MEAIKIMSSRKNKNIKISLHAPPSYSHQKLNQIKSFDFNEQFLHICYIIMSIEFIQKEVFFLHFFMQNILASVNIYLNLFNSQFFVCRISSILNLALIRRNSHCYVNQKI